MAAAEESLMHQIMPHLRARSVRVPLPSGRNNSLGARKVKFICVHTEYSSMSKKSSLRQGGKGAFSHYQFLSIWEFPEVTGWWQLKLFAVSIIY